MVIGGRKCDKLRAFEEMLVGPEGVLAVLNSRYAEGNSVVVERGSAAGHGSIRISDSKIGYHKTANYAQTARSVQSCGNLTAAGEAVSSRKKHVAARCSYPCAASNMVSRGLSGIKLGRRVVDSEAGFGKRAQTSRGVKVTAGNKDGSRGRPVIKLKLRKTAVSEHSASQLIGNIGNRGRRTIVPRPFERHNAD